MQFEKLIYPLISDNCPDFMFVRLNQSSYHARSMHHLGIFDSKATKGVTSTNIQHFLDNVGYLYISKGARKNGKKIPFYKFYPCIRVRGIKINFRKVDIQDNIIKYDIKT